jgi:hypothetical protein
MSIPVPPEVGAALATSIKFFLPRPLDHDRVFPVFVFDRRSQLTVNDLGNFAKVEPNSWRFVLRDHGVPVATCDVTRVSRDTELSQKFELTEVSEGEDRAKELVGVVSRAEEEVKS